jgi:hypothetical protein
MGHLLVDVYLFSFGSQFTLLHGEWMLPQTEYFVKWRQQMPIARSSDRAKTSLALFFAKQAG